MTRYTVEFCVIGSGYRHVTDYKSASEAIAAARLVYAALYVAIGRENPEHRGGTAPAVFEDIRKPHCTRTNVEPRNKAFFVAINKRRSHDT